MTLIETIKNDQVQARKDRDTLRASLLTTLYSEASMVGKNSGNRQTTDEETVQIIKKFINNANELLKVHDSSDAKAEIEILKSYLPQQMTLEQLQGTIDHYRSTHPGVKLGEIMSWLKATYPGLYDAKVASQIAKG